MPEKALSQLKEKLEKALKKLKRREEKLNKN